MKFFVKNEIFREFNTKAGKLIQYRSKFKWDLIESNTSIIALPVNKIGWFRFSCCSIGYYPLDLFVVFLDLNHFVELFRGTMSPLLTPAEWFSAVSFVDMSRAKLFICPKAMGWESLWVASSPRGIDFKDWIFVFSSDLYSGLFNCSALKESWVPFLKGAMPYETVGDPRFLLLVSFRFVLDPAW